MVMEGPKKNALVSPEMFVTAMRGETDLMLREVMAAVNDAPDGAWINASETRVRDLLGEYRRRVFERPANENRCGRGGFFPRWTRRRAGVSKIKDLNPAAPSPAMAA